ncbi:MAG: hypothetical protein SVT56_01820 [Chloroflexota bacterium]|nr:hypothetical protein [Chloroflexota bacterium]
MTHEQLALLQTVIGFILGSGGIAVINWLATRGKNKASKDLDLQEYWHKEFERLENRIKDIEEERDMTVKELKEEIQTLRTQLGDRDSEIERLTARIRELERLMKKYGIDPDKVSEDKPNE